MKKLDSVFFIAVFCVWSGVFSAAPPKVEVVLETSEGILLAVEYVSETDKASVVDVRAAILPPAFCEGKDLPKYLPTRSFNKPEKLGTGDCRFLGKPFVARSVTLAPTDIKKRHTTTLLTLSASGEKKQIPFFDESGKKALGFDFATEPLIEKGELPLLGVRAFAKDATMETMQTVDLSGKREVIYPSTNIFHKWSKLDPRIAFFYTPVIPTGEIGILQFGTLGFTLENSVEIPQIKFMPLKKYHMRLRGGIDVSYHTISQDLYQNDKAVSTGKIMLLPVMAQLTLLWDLRPGSWKMTISPFLKLADGVVISTVETQVKAEYQSLLAPGAERNRKGSYIGNGFYATVGFEVRPDKWPVAFALDGGYFIHSQDISGQYFIFHAGVLWHYGITPTQPKMLPIQYLGAKSVVLKLKGTVKNPDATAVQGAQLKLRAKGSDALVKESESDAKGAYSMEIEPGLDYILETRKDGYANATVEIPLISNATKTREQDFILAPLTYSLEGVNFKPDSDQLVTGKAPEKALTELVQFLKKNPEIRIEIGGHTAARGNDDPATVRLSEQRAETVRKYLANKGIEETRLTSKGYGGSKPIADGKTDAGAKKNRRVEVRILTE